MNRVWIEKGFYDDDSLSSEFVGEGLTLRLEQKELEELRQLVKSYGQCLKSPMIYTLFVTLIPVRIS